MVRIAQRDLDGNLAALQIVHSMIYEANCKPQVTQKRQAEKILANHSWALCFMPILYSALAVCLISDMVILVTQTNTAEEQDGEKGGEKDEEKDNEYT